jgi:HEAT repeat protein
MTNTCPACNKAVDPLRSRFVAVRGGKVVAYCSAGCAQAQGADRPAVSSHVSPASGVPTAIPTPPSGVPAHTPAAGIAARQTPAGGVPVGPPVPVTPAPGVPISLESGPVIEILHEPASGVVTSARDERTEPRAKHPDEIPMAAFWSADKESGQIRTITDPGSGAIKATTERSARDDTTLSKWANEETADLRRPRHGRSDTGDLDDELPGRSGRLRLAIVILLLLGAGGFLVYQYLVKPGLAAATRVPPPPGAPAAARAGRSEPAEPPKPLPPAVLDVPAAVGQARSTLEADLAATSQRLQRLAAAALARTQHPAARTLLAAQMAQSSTSDLSEIARLDLAYSLARGGDKRGGDALALALRSSRAEVRDEAARLLALLGDHRAVSHLTDVLAVTQRRLGAAEHLAHLDDPHAIKVLEQIWTDPASSANDKARAAIALATAGHRDVAPDLRAMLGDPHFNAFAAAALAELRDRAAQPVLVHQLESPALVVRAARALRRLDPALDPRPILPHLLDVLKTGRDTDQVQAAEAILLLAGPETLSTYD